MKLNFRHYSEAFVDAINELRRRRDANARLRGWWKRTPSAYLNEPSDDDIYNPRLAGYRFLRSSVRFYIF